MLVFKGVLAPSTHEWQGKHIACLLQYAYRGDTIRAASQPRYGQKWLIRRIVSETCPIWYECRATVLKIICCNSGTESIHAKQAYMRRFWLRLRNDQCIGKCLSIWIRLWKFIDCANWFYCTWFNRTIPELDCESRSAEYGCFFTIPLGSAIRLDHSPMGFRCLI